MDIGKSMKSIDPGIKSAKVLANQRKLPEAFVKNPHAPQAELATFVGITRKSIIANMKKLREQWLMRRSGADKKGFRIVEAAWQN